MQDAPEAAKAAKAPSRGALKQFFAFKVQPPSKAAVKPNLPGIMFVSIAATGAMAAVNRDPTFLGAAALVGALLGLVIFYMLEARRVAHQPMRFEGQERFRKLAQDARAVQRGDVVKMIQRAATRAGVGETAHEVPDAPVFAREQQIFKGAEGGATAALGPLASRCIRLYALAEGRDRQLRKIRWGDDEIESVFNPIRLAVIFFTDSELILCDAHLDCVKGDLSERIERIALKELAGVEIRTRRVQMAADVTEMRAKLEQDPGVLEGYEPVELATLIDMREQPTAAAAHAAAEAAKKGKKTAPRRRAREEVAAVIEIRRRGGGELLRFPMKSETLLRLQNVAALDDAAMLSEFEAKLDKLGAELNARIASARDETPASDRP